MSSCPALVFAEEILRVFDHPDTDRIPVFETEDCGKLAYLFHGQLAQFIVAACVQVRTKTNISTAALSGGVFQNHLLTELTTAKLKQQGFHVLRHSLIPPNDGGICLGQAVAAMYHLNQK